MDIKTFLYSKPESLSALMIQICLSGLGDEIPAEPPHLAILYYRKRKRDGQGMNLARLFEN